jgi:hypothetical protein
MPTNRELGCHSAQRALFSNIFSQATKLLPAQSYSFKGGDLFVLAAEAQD